MTTERKLESNSFNTYPHYVFATAFLVNGELADYKISDRETDWGLRTFRARFKSYSIKFRYNYLRRYANDKRRPKKI